MKVIFKPKEAPEKPVFTNIFTSIGWTLKFFAAGKPNPFRLVTGLLQALFFAVESFFDMLIQVYSEFYNDVVWAILKHSVQNYVGTLMLGNRLEVLRAHHDRNYNFFVDRAEEKYPQIWFEDLLALVVNRVEAERSPD